MSKFISTAFLILFAAQAIAANVAPPKKTDFDWEAARKKNYTTVCNVFIRCNSINRVAVDYDYFTVGYSSPRRTYVTASCLSSGFSMSGEVKNQALTTLGDFIKDSYGVSTQVNLLSYHTTEKQRITCRVVSYD